MPDFIKPKISSEKAKNTLSSPPGFLKKKKVIKKLELFYLPSYIVDVQVTTQEKSQIQSLCIDAVLGSFAFFQLSEITPSPDQPYSTCPFLLQEHQIHDKAIEEYRRHLLLTGLRMRYRFQIDKIYQ